MEFKFTPFPTVLVYSDDMPADFGGYAKGPFVKLRPKYKGKDEGIHQHEFLHVTQWYTAWLAVSLLFVAATLATGFIPLLFGIPICASTHSIMYLLIPNYRMWCEVEAYKKQSHYYPDDRLPRFAKFVSESYNLKVTQQQVLDMMRK